MVQIASFLASLALLHLTTAAPTAVPLGSTGRSLLISEDGTTASLDGRSIDLRTAFKRDASCAPGTSDPGSEGGNWGSRASARAIYFISNDPSGNSVVALKVNANGTLSDGSITPTGGKGLSAVDSDGKPANVDGLNSQGSVKISGNTLLAVNPGSNTVSMFTISPNNPFLLTQVGQPAPTLGDFPVSIAMSPELSTACVANSGANSGISCLSITPTGLKPLDTTQRPIPLSQSTPPSGPLNTISQTFFNADSTALMTTVKGNGMANDTGFLSIFPVENGCVSTNEIKSSPPGTAVLFGTALLPGKNNEFLVTDASFGSVTISVSSNGTASTLAKTTVEGQKATCWATFSEKTWTGFVADVGVNRLVEVDVRNGTIVKEYMPQNGNLGMIDLEGKGDFIYALAPGNTTAGRPASVSVWDVSGGRGTAKEIQNFMPSGVSDTVQGMAIL